jgi:hypothetical protein
VFDPLGVGQVYTDQYEEDNIGYPVTTVSPVLRQMQGQCQNYALQYLTVFDHLLLHYIFFNLPRQTPLPSLGFLNGIHPNAFFRKL